MLPEDVKSAKKVVAEATMYTISNKILYFASPTQSETSQVVVLQHLCHKLMQEYHDGQLAGYFSGVVATYVCRCSGLC